MKSRFTFLLLLSMCLCVHPYAQTHYYFNGGNEMHLTSNWGTDTTGSGNQPANFSQAGDTFEIRNTLYIALTANWTVSGTNAKIIVGDGRNSVHLIIPENYVCTGSITLKPQTMLCVFNTQVPVFDSLYANTLVQYLADGDQALSDKMYYDLNIGGTGSKTSTGDLIVAHALTVNGTLDMNAAGEDLLGGFMEVNGNGLIRTNASGVSPLPINIRWNCTVEFYRNSGTQSIPGGVYNKLSISGGTASRNLSGGSLQIDSLLRIEPGTTLALNEYILTGLLDSLSGSGTITTQCSGTAPIPANRQWPFHVSYLASENQTVRTGTYLQNLSISSGGTKSADGPIQVIGNLSVTGSTFNLGEFALFGDLQGISGVTGVIQTANTSPNPLPAGKVWTQTVIYAADTTQFISSGTYNHLTLNTAPKTCFAAGPIQITGNFVLSSNDTLHMLSYPLALNTLSSGNGVLITACTDSLPLTPGKTWNGIGVYYSAASGQTVVPGQYTYLNLSGGPRTFSISDTIKISSHFVSGTDSIHASGSVVAFTGSSSQQVQLGCSGAFGSFCLQNGTNKIISGGDLFVDETLHIVPGATLVMGSNRLLGIVNVLSGTGTLTTTCGINPPLPTGRTWPFAVSYVGSSVAQTIVEGSYSTLSITSGSDVNRAGGPIEIRDDGLLQISSNNVLDLGTYTLSTGSAITNGGAGTIRTQHTGSTPLTPNGRWTQHVSYNASAAQQVVSGTYLGNLIVNGGERRFDSTGIIAVAENFTASTNTQYITTGSSFAFNGNNNQTITLFVNFSFDHVRFSGSGTKTLNNSLNVNATLTINENAVVNLGSNALNGDEMISVGDASGLLRTQSADTNPWPANKMWNFRMQADGPHQTIAPGTYLAGLILKGNAAVKSMNGPVSIADTLSIQAGTQLMIGANCLTLKCVLTNDSGTITGSAMSDLVIDTCAFALGTLFFTQDSLSSRTLRNLTLNRNPIQGSEAMKLGNEVRIQQTLTLLNGTLNSNGNLVFESLSLNHAAQLAPVSGTGNILGAVTVQRALSGKPIVSNARWRFLSSPVNATQSIAQSWQQQIHITGPGAGGNACPQPQPNLNGFDVTQTQNPSLFFWNTQIQNWQTIPGTTNDSLICGRGYRVFFRGKRTQGCALLQNNPPDPQDTVLSVTGALQIGPVNLACATVIGGFALLGNPYQATIDWLSPGIEKTRLTPTIFSYRDNTSATGSYASYTSIPVPDSTNGMSRFLSPGTAFFVQTNDSGSAQITFNESCKSVNRCGESFFKTEIPLPQQNIMRIRLFIDTATTLKDEAVLRILPGTTTAYQLGEDVLKFQQGMQEIGIYTTDPQRCMSICRIPPLSDSLLEAGLHIPLPPVVCRYRLDFTAVNSFDPNIDLELFDRNNGSLVNLKKNPVYTFETAFDSTSVNPNRFFIRLHFKAASTFLTENFIGKADTLYCYPVPARQFIQLPFPGKNIRVYTQHGQLCMQESSDANATTLDISMLPSGIYYLETEKNGEPYRFTLVKE